MLRLRKASAIEEPRILRARGVTLADPPPAAPPADAAPKGDEPPAPGAVPEVPKQKWIEVATSGVYKGHGDDDFTLDKSVFDQFVANLRADPRYKAGPDGVGIQPVVPFDYEHVSEMDPREGTVPLNGVPSPAWALDFKVEGDATASSLWAFVEFGDTVREQIQKKEYMFVSIAFTLDATDPNTDAPIGALITSIAFTNHPFLRDLQPLAASSRKPAGSVRGIQKLSYYYGDAANSPEQGFEYTRSILNLPASTTTDEVLAEVTKVISWASTPNTAPAGVDVDELMCKLRSCWTVPVTWSAQQVLEEIAKAAEALKPAATPPTGETPPTPPAPTPASAPVTNTNPSPAAAAPPAALTSTEPNAMDPKKIVGLFNSQHTKGKVMLDAADPAAVEAAITGAVNDQATLASILEALGVANASDALKSIAELTGSRAKLADALAQLDQVLAMQEQVDAATEAQDVGAAMSANGLNPDDARPRKAFSAQRAHAITAALAAVPADKRNPKTLSEARTEARRAFLAEHGVADQAREHLLTNIVAGPGPAGSTQLEPPARAIPLSGNRGGPGPARGISLAGIQGANSFQRLCHWVQANEKAAGGQPLSWDAACARANALRSDSTVAIDESP